MSFGSNNYKGEIYPSFGINKWELKRKNKEVYFYTDSADGKVDFVIRDGLKIKEKKIKFIPLWKWLLLLLLNSYILRQSSIFL